MKKNNILLFLLGLGTYTKVFFMGCVAITEVVAFIWAPILFFKELPRLRREGFLPFLTLTLLSAVGCVLATKIYGDWFFDWLYTRNQLAQLYAVLSIIILFRHLLISNFNGLKWFLLGVLFSSVISIFILNPEISHGEVVSAGVEDILDRNMFWMMRLRAVMDVFVGGFYLQMPLIVSIVFPLFYVVFLALTTETGRSASLVAIAACVLIVCGRKSVLSMRGVSKHFILYLIVLLLGLGGAKFCYEKTVKSGALGEKALGKYEHQTKEGNSALKMLMRGRIHFFIGLSACLDNPIVGYGSLPRDMKGYYQEFVTKYGDVNYEAMMARYYKAKGFVRFETIPAHSYIIGGWVRHGIFGFLMWAYVIILCVNHLRKNMAVIPQWYGMFALYIPTLMWDIFFSPFTERVMAPVAICCLLIARAVGLGRIKSGFSDQVRVER